MDHKNIIILFPGIGYTNDKPLLYYSGKLGKQLGYDVKPITYSGFPANVKGDQDKMKQCFDLALHQTELQLKEVDWSLYHSIVFVSKSIGTAVAAAYATNMEIDVKHVLLTPLAETFQVSIPEAIAFHGTADPWAKTRHIEEACSSQEIPLTIIKDANHSLETGDVSHDIKILKKVMAQINIYLLSLL